MNRGCGWSFAVIMGCRWHVLVYCEFYGVGGFLFVVGLLWVLWPVVGSDVLVICYEFFEIFGFRSCHCVGFSMVIWVDLRLEREGQVKRAE